MTRTCTTANCQNKVKGHGLCQRHYYAAFNSRPRKTPEELFWAKVVKQPDGCWLWTGYRNHLGYGQLTINCRRKLAHRASYEWTKGAVGEGLVLDHLCRVPSCVNPDHLEAVTQRINLLRGEGASGTNARKTHCIAGHPLSGDNVKPVKDGTGRECRTCRKRWDDERVIRRREARAVARAARRP